MRQTKSYQGITLKAYAGTTGVLLAFNVTALRRRNLLGFAIEKQRGSGQPWEWLNGMIPFPDQPHDPGAPLPTNLAPIQKFRWSDYAVDPETNYKYRVHGVYGDWRAPTFVKGPAIAVTTSSNDADGVHSVNFNRAAGASQAFSRKFRQAVKLIETARAEGTISKLNVDDLDRADPGCKSWLTRNVLPQILDVLDDALDATWALDIAIYEYEWHEIVQAVNDAATRGVHIRLLYHSKDGDKQTAENEHNARPLILAKKARPRVTTGLFHQKFVVLSRAKKTGGKLVRTPHTVLCGSTNFTHNGLFRQANVVHVVRPEKGLQTNPVADRYAQVFDLVWNGKGPAAAVDVTNQWISANNVIDATAALFAGFSPRAKKADLAHFVQLIGRARNDVLFATAFKLPADIVAALKGKEHDPILRLGVQNRDDNEIAGVHRDRTAQFAAVALLDHGFDGWLREVKIAGAGDIFIHTKIVVVDFTTDRPVVISGSHNLSANASGRNDENYLVIQGNTDVADSYGVEVMRLYDHYRARWSAQKFGQLGGGPLKTSDAWTDRYFKENSLPFRDRLRFVGK